MKIDLGEAFEDLPEKAGIIEALELVGQQELLQEDVLHIGRKTHDVVDQVGVELAGVLLFEFGEGEARSVVGLDVAADCSQQDRFPRLIIDVDGQVRMGRQDGVLGGLQDQIKAAQHDQGQHDFAVLRLLEIPPQQLSDGPSEVRKRLHV